MHTNEIFIENGRFHGHLIADSIAAKSPVNGQTGLRGPVPTCSRRLFVISLLAVSTPLTGVHGGANVARRLCVLLAVLAMAHLLFSQDIRTATLVGTVTDSSGAVVPNVAVTVTNIDTRWLPAA